MKKKLARIFMRIAFWFDPNVKPVQLEDITIKIGCDTSEFLKATEMVKAELEMIITLGDRAGVRADLER